MSSLMCYRWLALPCCSWCCHNNKPSSMVVKLKKRTRDKSSVDFTDAVFSQVCLTFIMVVVWWVDSNEAMDISKWVAKESAVWLVLPCGGTFAQTGAVQNVTWGVRAQYELQMCLNYSWFIAEVNYGTRGPAGHYRI